jgi:Swi5-dependent recombination DNA repair protein 1
MDSTPIVKRRKLNSAVNKPFKSPLKTSLNQIANPRVPSPLASAPVKDASNDHAGSPNAGSLRTPTLQSTPLKRMSYPGMRNTSTSPLSASSDPATSREIQNSMRTVRTIESNLMKTRQEIDTLDQAIRLVTSNKDAELDALAIKWRVAARQAAEEVFAGARDKVNRMGGVGAWRERQEEMAQSNWWDEPVKKDKEELYDDNDDLIEMECPEKEECYEDEWEYDAEARKQRKQDEGRDDDVGFYYRGYQADLLMFKQGFTMDMMLKMMNIDLQLIGYDKKRQRWVG